MHNCCIAQEKENVLLKSCTQLLQILHCMMCIFILCVISIIWTITSCKEIQYTGYKYHKIANLKHSSTTSENVKSSRSKLDCFTSCSGERSDTNRYQSIGWETTDQGHLCVCPMVNEGSIKKYLASPESSLYRMYQTNFIFYNIFMAK